MGALNSYTQMTPGRKTKSQPACTNSRISQREKLLYQRVRADQLQLGSITYRLESLYFISRTSPIFCQIRIQRQSKPSQLIATGNIKACTCLKSIGSHPDQQHTKSRFSFDQLLSFDQHAARIPQGLNISSACSFQIVFQCQPIIYWAKLSIRKTNTLIVNLPQNINFLVRHKSQRSDKNHANPSKYRLPKKRIEWYCKDSRL